MTAPIAVTINGVSIPNVERNSFSLESIMGQTIATARLKIFDEHCALTIPEEADVLITRPDTGESLFGGLTAIIEEYGEGVSRWFDIRCQDYGRLLDTSLILANYPAGYTNPSTGHGNDQGVIEDVFANRVLDDVGSLGASEINATTYVQNSGISLSPMLFQYHTLREFLSSLASYTNRDFRIDADKKLHYYLYTGEAAPFNIGSAPNFAATPPKIAARGPRFRRDCTSLINVMYAFGPNLFSNDREWLLGTSDSTATVFDLGANLGVGNAVLVGPTTSPAGKIRVYTYYSGAWHEMTVGVDGVDTMPTFDCLHNAMAHTLTFNVAPGVGTGVVSVKIQGRYQIGAGSGLPLKNSESITAYNRKFVRRVVASDANATAALSQKVNTLLNRYGGPLKTAPLTVDDTFFPPGNTDRFKVGQYLTWDDGVLGRTENMVIYKITTNISGGAIRSYGLELRNYV